MKKTYINPSVRWMEAEGESLMGQSGVSSELNVEYGGKDETEEGMEASARQHATSVWDE